MTTSTLCSKLRLGCKCIELLLAIVCMGLYVNAPIYHAKGYAPTPAGTLMTITFGGYIIIQLGVIVGFLCDEKVPKKTDLLYTLAGLCLFIAAGSVGINYYQYHQDHPDVHKPTDHSGNHNDDDDMMSHGMMSYGRTGMACAAIAIINGGIFLFDAMLSYKDVSENYTPH